MRLTVAEAKEKHPIREELGEDMWLFASDWPHSDSAWPEAVRQTVERPRLTESARRQILGKNAMRLCPRLRA